MAAKKGNQLWKLRAKHGRDTLFADAQALLHAAYEYFEYCDNTPHEINDFISSGPKAGRKVKVETARLYTLSGLCIYLDCGQSYFRNFKLSPACTEDFKAVITRIEEIIETQQLEGAAAGFFNANIISRKLGLAEKVDTSVKDYRVKIDGEDNTEDPDSQEIA